MRQQYSNPPILSFVDLIKGKRIDWPRLEDKDYIMVVGSARPLIDAFRLAHVELIEWLVDEYGGDIHSDW